MLRQPAVSLAEIMWRWSFGAAACFLLGFGFLEYLDTLPVSNGDRLLLRTRHPVLISHALSHVLEGSALRFMMATIVLFSALAVLWVFISALGRGVTLRPLVSYIRERAHSVAPDSVQPEEDLPGSDVHSWRLHPLIGLNFLRASLALAASGSLLAAVILAGFASSKSHPHPGTVFLLGCLFIVLVWLTWSSISWFLSVASIFAVRPGNDTFGSLISAVEMCRDRPGPMVAVGTWFGLTHLVLFFVAASVVSFPLGFAQVVPPRIVLTAVLLLTLLYFAIVDTLYIGRLAAYVAILEAPPERETSPVLPSIGSRPGTQQSTVGIQPASEMVDQDERILSDLASTQHPALSVPSVADRIDPDELILSDHPETNREGSEEN